MSQPKQPTKLDIFEEVLSIADENVGIATEHALAQYPDDSADAEEVRATDAFLNKQIQEGVLSFHELRDAMQRWLRILGHVYGNLEDIEPDIEWDSIEFDMAMADTHSVIKELLTWVKPVSAEEVQPSVADLKKVIATVWLLLTSGSDLTSCLLVAMEVMESFVDDDLLVGIREDYADVLTEEADDASDES